MWLLYGIASNQIVKHLCGPLGDPRRKPGRPQASKALKAALPHAADLQRMSEYGENSSWRQPASGPQYTPGGRLVYRLPILPCRAEARKCPPVGLWWDRL